MIFIKLIFFNYKLKNTNKISIFLLILKKILTCLLPRINHLIKRSYIFNILYFGHPTLDKP